MAVAWTSITNAQVAAGAALTTALVTALRDNPEGIAQRATGAPKIFGVPYDYQEFTASGTWYPPANFETGDRVLVQVVAGGASGGYSNTAGGGGGGGGYFGYVNWIDGPPASVAITIGAGGAAVTSTNGNAGGNTSFGAATGELERIVVLGGATCSTATGGAGGNIQFGDTTYGVITNQAFDLATGYGFTSGGVGGSATATASDRKGKNSMYGGGGGGAGYGSNGDSNIGPGGWSNYAGNGGYGTSNDTLPGDDQKYCDGQFPGGGGAGADSSSGATESGTGANGVVRVWCLKEE